VDISLEKIDLIAFSNGPGSFTGLRIGLAALKGLSLAKKIPLCPFNTLKVLAANFAGLGVDIMPCIDAKMNEVYAAVYDTNLNEKQPPLNTALPQMLERIAEPVIMVGNIANKYRDLISASDKDIKLVELHQNIPMASAMISLVYRENIRIGYDASSIAALEPYYLRKSQAEINFG
jgi:tRNA threonylcarbamoyl adenosine modification protein YeaZ